MIDPAILLPYDSVFTAGAGQARHLRTAARVRKDGIDIFARQRPFAGRGR